MRGGKCNQYLHCGVIQVDKIDEQCHNDAQCTDASTDVAGVCQNNLSLNFTHRAAHGGKDDGDVDHG